MQHAQQAFKKGEYTKSIELYNKYLSQQAQAPTQQNKQRALLNFASVYYSNSEYQNSLKTCYKYSQTVKQSKKQPNVECYILYCKCLIKMKKILSHEEHQFLSEGQAIYPYHKVLQQNIKTIKQIQISQNQDQYMDRIFQKLLSHPKIRTYMVEEEFLTKVEKIIRNPSLASALCKIDKRLEEVGDVILMAEDEEEQQRNQLKIKSK